MEKGGEFICPNAVSVGTDSENVENVVMGFQSVGALRAHCRVSCVPLPPNHAGIPVSEIGRAHV